MLRITLLAQAATAATTTTTSTAATTATPKQPPRACGPMPGSGSRPTAQAEQTELVGLNRSDGDWIVQCPGQLRPLSMTLGVVQCVQSGARTPIPQ